MFRGLASQHDAHHYHHPGLLRHSERSEESSHIFPYIVIPDPNPFRGRLTRLYEK